jgi:hypothetical protein
MLPSCGIQRRGEAFAALWFFARLIFDPEDGSDTFLRNVGSHTHYTALYPRRQRSKLEVLIGYNISRSLLVFVTLLIGRDSSFVLSVVKLRK